jgi:RNA polymerase sigma factor (sigma-70 family)
MFLLEAKLRNRTARIYPANIANRSGHGRCPFRRAVRIAPPHAFLSWEVILMYYSDSVSSVPAPLPALFEDSYLVELAKAGQQHAFIELVERHSRLVMRTALRIVKNQEDAEDVLQEAFTSAFIHLQRFDGRSQFSTWLTRIAINASLMVLRKRRIRGEVACPATEEESHHFSAHMVERTPGPELYCIRKQRANHLHEAISRLRPNLRKVVEVQLAFECSVEHTAESIGISVPATKSRLMRARKTLKSSMTRRHQI